MSRGPTRRVRCLLASGALPPELLAAADHEADLLAHAYVGLEHLELARLHLTGHEQERAARAARLVAVMPSRRWRPRGLRSALRRAGLAEARVAQQRANAEERRNMDHAPEIAAGIDGCRAGWVAAIARWDGTTELRLFVDLDAVLRWHERDAGGTAAVGVDVPMGLPVRAGLRACDRAARQELGARWMSVFAAPDRQLLGHDFAGARAIVHGRRREDSAGAHPVMTQQTMNIAPKVAEADRLLRGDPRRQDCLVEVHPELSFLALAGAPVEPKRTPAGAAWRRALVAEQFPDAVRRLDGTPWPRSQVAPHDLLDAYAALWSALRFAAGPGRYRELGDGLLDDHGLSQRIVV